MINKKYKRLLKLKNILDDICVGDITTWKDRILLESIHDNKFLKLAEYVFYNFLTWDSEQLNLEFKKIIDLAYKQIKKNVNKKSVIEQYNNVLKVERYYGIIEQIDELSSLSENLYKTILEKYGYEKIAQIDKDNPSNLTNFYRIENIEEKKYSDDDINKYLVLKKWQDLQNIFVTQILDETLKSDNVEEKIYNNCLINIKSKTTFRKKYEIYKLLNEKYISIDMLSQYYAIGMLDDLKEYIGGKAYGLAILNCFHKIPKTIVISAYTNNYDLSDFIEETKTYAVRSSADCEDNSNNSFAGMFDSVLNVSPKQIDCAITKVKNSVNNLKVQEYIKTLNLKNPHMNVIVQEFIKPDFSGVWLADSINSGLYETVDGVGEDLVSGKVVPTLHNFNKKDLMCKFFVKLQQKIGTNCDFEFCVTNNQIIMLQCRPVTTIVKNEIKISDGVGTSCGEIEGEIQFIEDPEDIHKFKDGKILVTYATDPVWVPAIIKSKGIITSFGGYLCHTSIIARELNKPCVVGVNKELFSQIIKAKKIKMNGFTGKILILE